MKMTDTILSIQTAGKTIAVMLFMAKLFIFAVGFAEEFVFRGYIYKKILNISGKETAAVIVSSVLFGLFHIFRGSIVQVITTAFIGAFFCLCRAKIKGCTIVSLIIAHGIYDALITVWTAVL